MNHRKLFFLYHGNKNIFAKKWSDCGIALRKISGHKSLTSTIIGILAGIARSSKNILLRNLASCYVAIIRQVPLLLQLLFWYFIAFIKFSNTPLKFFGDLIVLSNQGIALLGLKL